MQVDNLFLVQKVTISLALYLVAKWDLGFWSFSWTQMRIDVEQGVSSSIIDDIML